MSQLALPLPRQRIRYIDTPAVDTEWGLQPVTRDGIICGVHFFAQAQTAIVEFGEALYPQPGLILIWPLMEREKFGAGSVQIGLGSQEPRVFSATMVRNEIEHKPHASLIQCIAQGNQRLVATKVGIDMLIIYRVIFMIAGRSENRSEIESIDAQVLQVVYLSFAQTSDRVLPQERTL